jgi:hypothetical protein
MFTIEKKFNEWENQQNITYYYILILANNQLNIQ